MTILQQIIEWGYGQPEWQQDAIRRIYFNRSLSSSDLDDLYALAKTEQGINDPLMRQPMKLAGATIAASQVPNRRVQITAIKNLNNVNALAVDQNLSIALTGLTVIYGENGAGKSGYSRVLKKACRARDQTEAILPDARKPPNQADTPQATFDVLIDGNAISLGWNNETESPEELSEIAVFDSHCARAYVDNEGDFAYAPYGLDILEGLVKACNAVKGMAKSELSANRPNTEPFAELAKSATMVGAMLSNLSAETKPSEIEKLATLSEDETGRHAFLNVALAEAEPKQKAQILRLKSSRFTQLAARIDAALKLVDDKKLNQLQDLVEKSNYAKQAAEYAAKKFKGTPGFLPGTGDEIWKELFEAARQFAVLSYADSKFPQLTPSSACPLCQSELGSEGVAKLNAFENFVKQKVEVTAKEARDSAAIAYRAIDNAMLDLAIDDALSEELKGAFPENYAMFSEFQKVLRERREAAMKAASGSLAWDSILPAPTSPSQYLIEKSRLLQVEAKLLEDSSDAKARSVMVMEQEELEARKKLSELKETALSTVAKFSLIAKLGYCEKSILTAPISRKSTALSEGIATEEVVCALNEELRLLNVHELQVVMKPISRGGKTRYKLVLQLPGGAAPSVILSEGEQRATAIASFLAEVRLGKGHGGIVFDDPVSSLDHRRRSDVANRLVYEARCRQVVVFTHDIYFLCMLQQQASLDRQSISTQCIARGPAGFGVQSNSLPFETLKTSDRVKELRKLREEVNKAHKAGDEAEAMELSRRAYSKLRMAWERGVEEVLFQGVVIRFREGISTSMLRHVTVEDSDYEAINNGMTRSSKYSGHDPADIGQLATPHPDSLLEDINKLEIWRKRVEKRNKEVGARRKLAKDCAAVEA